MTPKNCLKKTIEQIKNIFIDQKRSKITSCIWCIQNQVKYFSYGNMKLKLSLSKKNVATHNLGREKKYTLHLNISWNNIVKININIVFLIFFRYHDADLWWVEKLEAWFFTFCNYRTLYALN